MKMLTSVKKANGIIRKGIEYKTTSIIMPLYRIMVQHFLEFCLQFWLPYILKDIAEQEIVQMRATKMIKGL